MKNHILVILLISSFLHAQNNARNYDDFVNVFMGSSGDYGQLSPSASYPFSMLSLGPQTYPHNHTGYDNKAQKFDGFTHTHLEGVGCKGSGGNILIKPILDSKIETPLMKENEIAKPGYYRVDFENKINVQLTVNQNYGIHKYHFPKDGQILIDLSNALVNRFVAQQHQIKNNEISGYIDTKTTCDAGIYRIYFCIKVPEKSTFTKIDNNRYIVDLKTTNAEIKVGLSSVDVTYAKSRITEDTFDQTYEIAKKTWNNHLGVIDVTDKDTEKIKLFYSLLYRTLQAPYLISENDGKYRSIDGQIQQANFDVYHGWAIWDNYREIMPMLSLFYPKIYKNIALSIANLYPYGKKDFATQTEPAPTVRTEHAVVVLLDALNKDVKLPIKTIIDSLESEATKLRFDSPDKALESSYDLWALSEIFKNVGNTTKADFYSTKAKEYKNYWLTNFKDLEQPDVDIMQARKLYQGTIWQYRWLVPYDINGLKALIGSEQKFIDQLDTFFDKDYYNHANQPDLQVPGLYNATSEPWKSQKLFHKLMLENVNQFYFNDNSKGIDPYIGRIYQNKSNAFLRTMDDDLGTMSAWFVLRSLGFSAANVGEPYFYLTAPIFEKVELDIDQHQKIIISNKNGQTYIDQVVRNKKLFNKNYIHYSDFKMLNELEYKTQNQPNHNWPSEKPWVSQLTN